MWNIFKKKQAEPDQNIVNKSNKKMFICHYCKTEFEVLPGKTFPTSVPKIGSDYFFQGIGILCPHCLKTCIYG
jgi:hypothetical protein